MIGNTLNNHLQGVFFPLNMFPLDMLLARWFYLCFLHKLVRCEEIDISFSFSFSFIRLYRRKRSIILYFNFIRTCCQKIQLLTSLFKFISRPQMICEVSIFPFVKSCFSELVLAHHCLNFKGSVLFYKFS